MEKLHIHKESLALLLVALVLLAGCSKHGSTGDPLVTAKVETVARLAQSDQQAAILGALTLTQDQGYCLASRDNPSFSARTMARNLSKYEMNLRSESASVYAQVFTARELDALSQFYATSEGRSITNKLPQLYGALSAIGAPYVRAAATGGDPVPLIPCATSETPVSAAPSK
jgi:hypothetical protein